MVLSSAKLGVSQYCSVNLSPCPSPGRRGESASPLPSKGRGAWGDRSALSEHYWGISASLTEEGERTLGGVSAVQVFILG